jgi:hypothetical protein
MSGNAVIGSGLKAGDIVVTAGAHQLKEGQKVKRLADAMAIAVPGPATIKSASRN